MEYIPAICAALIVGGLVYLYFKDRANDKAQKKHSLPPRPRDGGFDSKE